MYQTMAGKVPSGWGDCADCGSLRLLSGLLGGVCTDKWYCARASALRMEVELEFAELHEGQEHARDTVLEEVRAHAKARRNERVADLRPHPPPESTCEGCGVRIVRAKQSRARKFCSPTCATRVHSRKRRAARKAAK